MSLPSIHPYRWSAAQRSDGHEPAAARTHWKVDPGRAALLVHDMQNHFVNAFTRRPDAQITHAIEAMRGLADAARIAGVPVVYTAQPPRQDQADRQLLTDFWGAGLLTDEAAQIIDELRPRPQDVVLTKWRYSAFHRTDLLHRLRNHGRDQLIITGVYSHIGCLATALEAFMQGIQVFFVPEAQADFSREDHDMAAAYVSTRCGQVATAQEIVEALVGPARDRASEAATLIPAGA